MIDWLMAVLYLLPQHPDKSARRFNDASSRWGDRLRFWLYGLIGAAVLLLLVALGVLWLAN